MIGAIATAILNGVLGKALDAFKLWTEKKITQAEMDAQVKEAVTFAVAQIEAEWAKAAADIFASAQQTVRASFKASSWFVRNAWAFVLYTQTCVLLWYQVGIPLVTWAFDLAPGTIPRTGDDLLQWAYLLVGGALGLGVIQMKRPGADFVGKVLGKGK